MSRLKHGSNEQFTSGLNVGRPLDKGLLSVPIPVSLGLGWKELYEGFTDGLIFSADAVPKWELEVVTTGTAASVAGGVALLPKDDTDNSATHIRWTTPTLIMGANTKQFYFETRATLTDNGTDPNQAESFIGFTEDATTTNFVNAGGTAWAFEDGFGFGHLDADTSISFVAMQSDVVQIVRTSKEYVSGVPRRLGCWYDGTNYNIYVDGELDTSALRVVYNNDAAMGMSLFAKNGEAKTKDLVINYVYLAAEL